MLREIELNMSLSEIETFLKEHKEKVNTIAYSNECGKWSRWLVDDEKPYPCVCQIRNDGCIFMEVYHELFKIYKFSKQEYKCLDALLDYHSIKHNDEKVKDWFRTNFKLHEIISEYEEMIWIKKISEPIEYIKIKVECPNSIKDYKMLYEELIEEYWSIKE